MRLRWVQYSFFLSLGLLTLTALYLSRRPACIDSRFVERIDRLSSQGEEVLYRCEEKRDPAQGRFFLRNQRALKTRIEFLEERLWRIAPWRSTVRITILESRPWVFRLQGRGLYIGEKILAAEGHLERGLIKAWIRDQALTSGDDHDMQEEVLADWIWSFLKGQLMIEDPLRALRTRVGTRWPQVVKDENGYCSSPWRLSEHFEACARNPGELQGEASRLSLRPLLSSSMIDAFAVLSTAEQLRLLRSLPRGKVFESSAARDESVESPVLWERLSILLRRFQAEMVPGRLRAEFSKSLKRSGFEGERSALRFDIFVDLPETSEKDERIIEELTDIAEKRRDLRVALRSGSRLWILPSRQSMGLADLEQLEADRWIVRRCGSFDFQFVLDFENRAEKLFVINDCRTTHLSLRSYLTGGVESFGRDNRSTTFVQFHLPSLLLRRDSLDPSQDVLSVIQRRDLTDPLFQNLGWQELLWSSVAEAYHPRAFVDAIEWFRLN